jgi:hypothetical protein
MKKPEMVIDSAPSDSFIAIRCSACDNFRVRIEGNTLSDKALVRGFFDLHFNSVHRHDDANQTSPRIVKEDS